ncbi:3-dehydroquinate synthase [Enterococcus sp. 8G7_MSG3316]|uniref:3-dehydroquinate synthase n=1 Tax=Candidatus Enterococcus testudinis TaxID=1834191 RepID=A0A242A6C7_9ENTE|nr:3-dehydroquinate synthase [Enterococcus sp. 8G7_MSG3316]OTN76450.1 3-dehydroquinate synthase [Enterococcus sp. 8G7_MSG3316]
MLHINLKDQSYDIIIEAGAFKKVGAWVNQLWQSQRVAVISDSHVASLYGEALITALAAHGFDAELLVVPAGEKSKSLLQATALYDQLAAFGMTRSDGIIALGGGVIGDLAGFVASTYMRGIHFLQIPTSLLAQVDSSIGGKTAVNTESAKNLVGTFSQPEGVLIDPELLASLPIQRVREGIAEIIKSAAIADLQLWQTLNDVKDERDLLSQAAYIITETLKVKQKVVEEDPFDHGSRLTLNFGHTIGHGLEKLAAFGGLSHGEGVAIGMVMITRHAEEIGLSPKGTTEQLMALLSKFNLPIAVPEVDRSKLFTAITHDKKARGNQIKIILLEAIGQAKIVTIPTETIKHYLV